MIDASTKYSFEDFWQYASAKRADLMVKMSGIGRGPRERLSERQESIKRNATDRIVTQFNNGQFPSFTDMAKAYSLLCSGHLDNFSGQFVRELEERLLSKITKREDEDISPSLSEIETAARFAVIFDFYHLNDCILKDVDLSSIPVNHLRTLAIMVVRHLSIKNVINTDLSPIFQVLNCTEITIEDQILSRDDTRALVKTMEGTTNTVLNFHTNVRLDFKALAEYSGQGSCV